MAFHNHSGINKGAEPGAALPSAGSKPGGEPGLAKPETARDAGGVRSPALQAERSLWLGKKVRWEDFSGLSGDFLPLTNTHSSVLLSKLPIPDTYASCQRPGHKVVSSSAGNIICGAQRKMKTPALRSKCSLKAFSFLQPTLSRLVTVFCLLFNAKQLPRDARGARAERRWHQGRPLSPSPPLPREPLEPAPSPLRQGEETVVAGWEPGSRRPTP